MLKFVVKIETGNAAFEELDTEFEVARILRELGEQLMDGKCPDFLFDANGNTVGTVTWTNG